MSELDGRASHFCVSPAREYADRAECTTVASPRCRSAARLRCLDATIARCWFAKDATSWSCSAGKSAPAPSLCSAARGGLRQLVATYGNSFGLSEPLWHRLIATNCHRLQPRASIKAPWFVVHSATRAPAIGRATR
jgi:hypothetical protein